MAPQLTNNGSFSSGASSTQLLGFQNKRRTAFFFYNTGSSTAYIAKGDISAISGQGIPLAPGFAYFESNDSGFECWQGNIQVIGSTTIAFAETFEAN